MAYREFTDGGGTQWRAWDTYPGSAANVRPGFEGGWLGFESGDERRRLAPVPASWEEASDDELREMLSRAQPNRPTRATPREEAEPALVAAHDPAPDPDDGVSRSRAVLERVRSVLTAVDRTLRSK
jgi:hypothetical protein